MDVAQFENYTKMIRARSSPAAVDYQAMLIITIMRMTNDSQMNCLIVSQDSGILVMTSHNYTHPLLNQVINDDMLYLLGELNPNGTSTAVFTASLCTLKRHKLKWNTRAHRYSMA